MGLFGSAVSVYNTYNTWTEYTESGGDDIGVEAKLIGDGTVAIAPNFFGLWGFAGGLVYNVADIASGGFGTDQIIEEQKKKKMEQIIRDYFMHVYNWQAWINKGDDMCATLCSIFCHCVLLEIGTEILFHRVAPIYIGIHIERSVTMVVFIALTILLFIFIYKDLLKSKKYIVLRKCTRYNGTLFKIRSLVIVLLPLFYFILMIVIA